MKVVINKSYGCFNISDNFSKAYKSSSFLDKDGYFLDNKSNRVNTDFIKALEEFGLDKATGDYAKLKIVEIPDESTDYMILEYDGIESVIYALNGKIYRIP